MTTSQPHTGSYYAATANQDAGYPPLSGEQHADVCIIGAGFTGISTALHLAERGYNVHVVEASKVGWGASGRNGGQMIGGISGEQKIAEAHGAGAEKLLWEMRWAGHDIIRERVARYGIDCDLKAGYLDVAIKKRHLAAFDAEFERLQRHNFPHEFRLLSAGETADLIGTDAYIGSLLNMGNGHLHPLNLCIGEARAAADNGATIYEGSPVLGVERGSKARVITERGSVAADWVVIAGNAYHSLLPELHGILFPVNSFITATEPLSAALVQQMNPRDLAVCDPNFVLEYFRLSADKRLLFGGRINYSGADPEYIKKNHRPRMLKIYPQLHDTRIDYAWGGTIGVPLNRVPQFGRVAPNVLFAQGYSGHGVNVTHLAGRILADVIAGTEERFDVFAKIKPVRVPGAYRFRHQLVALGVFYHQLRDWL
ncbi:MAG: FAD-binding oxidoreductase [Gammaproteobacteria bacterium]|nr:FAD-binding oxidoreductase [Gammaproteobacteria bacterium]MDH3362544.1 FAD-binding oxidoreductase [Gammaproteobacteria bacterium]MDH3480308.1 FAD-binding oxidoreductase [Gammaproteobacteria bacterium]